MAKAVRWQVPFVSLKGVQYRVDIYDTYTGTVPSTWPVQLQAGAEPFVTEEDADDDIFTPVRGTTGTLTVIDTDGTLFEQIVPESNTERPIRVYSVVNGTGTPVFDGFLGCEAYAQDYSGTAQELDLTVNDIIETMRSVELDASAASYTDIRHCLAAVLTKMYGLFPLTTFEKIYFSTASKAMMSAYIDTTILFDEYEQANEESVSHICYSKSCYDILSLIATFAGWTVRMQGKNIYFQRIGEERGMSYQSYSTFIASGTDMTAESVTGIQMSAMTWRGSGHQKSISQGARSVAINAAVKAYELSLAAPACPYGEAYSHYVSIWYSDYQYFRTPEEQSVDNRVTLCSRLLQMNNNAVTVSIGGVFDYVYASAWPSNDDEVHIYSDSSTRTFTTFSKYIGSFFVMTEELSVQRYSEPVSAVYLSGIGRTYVEGDPYALPSFGENTMIFKMATIKQFSAAAGWLRLFAKGQALTILDGDNVPAQVPFKEVAFTLYFTLKFGNKYWSGSAWVTEFAYFTRRFANGEIETNYSASVQTSTEHDDGYFIPINSRMTGVVELQIHFIVQGGTIDQSQVTPTEECFLTDLEITYEKNDYALKTDRDTNSYFKRTGADFAEEIIVDTEIASDMNNEPAASILSDGSSGISELQYIKSDGTTENRRPEHDLLDRMVSYYGAARRKVEVEVEHPTQNSLPLLTITGYDGMTYAPLAEERDWKTDTSKLTLFETI